MRNLLLAAIVLLASAGTALACRGNDEYPQSVEMLKSMTMEADKKAALMNMLLKGQKLHDTAHATSDGSMMGQSVKILDDVKSQMK